ncbi:MAG: permease [Bacteroidetes bacterium]|jgi:uncharacterized membrane protein YraQ (UPF0718 family)/copper chaperone CopZ|nr:permease [Bacteroidota bacterium]
MMQTIQAYLNELWGLTLEIAPYLLFGFLFAGLLRVYFPQRLLNKYMGKSSTKATINASLLGIPMPLCSCGVIPTGISLFRNGASRGSTSSFLISTPQTGVDSILVTYSMLGLPFAIIRPIVALITGITGGVFTNLLVKNKQSKTLHGDIFTADEAAKKTNGKFKQMLQYAFVTFLQDIMKWLLIGLILAALIAVLIPDNFFNDKINNDFLGMLLILVASIPLYVCATASVPVAAVLLLKGLSPGAVLVFLMAGPATNAATMTVLWKTLGKQTTLIYLATIVGGSLLFGLLINQLPANWFIISGHSGAHSHQLLPGWLELASAVTLILLIINGYYQKYFNNKSSKSEIMNANTNSLTFVKVSGMDCNHCKNSVELNLKKLAEIQSAEVDLTSQTVRIEGNAIDMEAIRETVEALGYKFEGKVENNH